jgi:ABC-type transport system involved in multi-copper enzyme maturation permease subunit
VLVKEFRTRMRGARAYWVLLVYVLLLTVVVGFMYLNWYSQTTAGGVSHQAASATGRTLFQVLFAFQAGLVALITPALTAGAVTIEREQQTYQMLATCGLKPPHIIVGKLMAAVAFVALLLTSSLPLVSLSFLLGGVSPGEVFGTYVSLALSALVFGSIGILCSAALRATAAATVATYTSVLLLFFLTLSPGLAVDRLPFRSVNAAASIFHSVDMEPFYTTRLPSWLIGVTLNLLMGLLFANLAMTKLEHFDEKRPIAVRGLSTALWTAFVLFFTGNFYGQSVLGPGSPTGRDTAIGVLVIYLALLLVALPIFTTGEWTAQEDGGEKKAGRSAASFLRGMLPDAMLRPELPAGAPLMGLWVLIAAASIVGGFVVMGKLPQFPLDILPLFLTIAAVLAAFTALGNFLSVAFQDRKATMVLTYLTIAAVCLLPFFGYMTWQASDRTTSPHLSWQFLYLTPFLTFIQASDANNSFWTNNPPMLLGQTPFWLVTGVLYWSLAAVLFALTLGRISRGKRVRE